MPHDALTLGRPSNEGESSILVRSFSLVGESSAIYSRRMITSVAIVDRILLRAFTNTVPTKELSGIKENVPKPSAANSSKSALSRLYPKPNVLIAQFKRP